jgi:hypothetical protein
MDQKTCPLSLYMKLEHLREACSRQITTVVPPPTLERQGTALGYYFMAPKQVFFRCRQQKGWTTESLFLEGPGVLRNTGRCHVTTEGTQLYPILTGETEFTGQAPELYTPALPSVTSPSESLKLRELTSTKELANLAANIQAHRLETDLDTYSYCSLHYNPIHDAVIGTSRD